MRNYLKIDRRKIILSAISTALLTGISFADEVYPSKRITFICAFPAGSGADIMVRYFADKIGTLTNQLAIVENKPGAGSNIAAEFTARSKPDGYTIYIHSGTTTAANMSLFHKPAIDPSKDLQGVAFISQLTMMISVKADSPINNISDLTAVLKEKGEKANYASSSASGAIVGAVYKKETGLNPVEVKYKTALESLNDIDSGIIDFGIFDPVTALANARTGRTKIVGIARGERMLSASELPTMKEAGLNIDLDNWWGVFVAAGTPEPILNKMNDLFKQILEMPDTIEFLASSGMDPYIGSPDDVQRRLIAEIATQRELVELAQIPKN